MFIAKAKTTATDMILEIEAPKVGVGSTVLLQRFPVTVAPRVGEEIGIAGVEGNFVVAKVKHSFSVSEENHHTVWIEVRKKS